MYGHRPLLQLVLILAALLFVALCHAAPVEEQKMELTPEELAAAADKRALRQFAFAKRAFPPTRAFAFTKRSGRAFAFAKRAEPEAYYYEPSMDASMEKRFAFADGARRFAFAKRGYQRHFAFA